MLQCKTNCRWFLYLFTYESCLRFTLLIEIRVDFIHGSCSICSIYCNNQSLRLTINMWCFMTRSIVMIASASCNMYVIQKTNTCESCSVRLAEGVTFEHTLGNTIPQQQQLLRHLYSHDVRATNRNEACFFVSCSAAVTRDWSSLLFWLSQVLLLCRSRLKSAAYCMHSMV